MLKSIGFVALWIAGSAAAVTVAWAGVRAVDDDLVAPQSVGVLSATGDTVGDATVVTTPTTTDGTGSTDTTDATTSTVARGSAGGAASPARNQGGSDAPTSAGAPSTTTSTVPSSSSTAPSSSTSSTNTTTTTTGSTGGAVQTLTFHLTGGSTAINFSAGGVAVAWATPNPGYQVVIEPESPGIKVEFRSSAHRSRIDAWWSNGPRHEIREEDR